MKRKDETQHHGSPLSLLAKGWQGHRSRTEAVNHGAIAIFSLTLYVGAAAAGTYRYTDTPENEDASNLPVGQDFMENLRRLGNPAMVGDRKFHSTATQFTWPKWQSINPAEHRNLVEQIWQSWCSDNLRQFDQNGRSGDIKLEARMRRRQCTAGLVAAMLALTTCAVAASTRFPVGEYTRIEDSNYGLLTITSTSQASFKFRLLALRQFPGDSDGFYTRNGEIEDGRAVIRGRSAIYRSAYEEDKKLGTCILSFRRSGSVITVTESGKCWWFGVGVNASGKYRSSERGVTNPLR